MKKNGPAHANKVVYLKDYLPADYLVETIHLTLELDPTATQVKAVIKIRKNPAKKSKKIPPLVLDGLNLKLKGIKLDGKELAAGSYRIEKDKLTIAKVPTQFVLEIDNEINPQENLALEGLYISGNIFCTQNEPQGFRRITYFLDRPDVMAKYTTKLIADKERYPVLLSNGNPVSWGDLEGNKHFIEWEDPFKKPSYLFAIVAGDLGVIRDEFVTASERKIDLRIYCDKGDEERCQHAMNSLKKAMKWDEERFGREYDLDIFMIVAVASFNQGAMENKGLNIFNSALVLANPQTATDGDYSKIEGVIGHEYFHNWTGNRITCRDWFQLTLKEGLTVFRDQEFSGDMKASAVLQRIDDTQQLRSRQFPEDAGPTAHPIRPSSYIEINNFYTSTIYEKGAEVIRMIQTLLGKKGFRKGMDKYFKLFDGQAVTTDDFIHAMVAANGFDFRQFKMWYNQAGTPELKARFAFDPKKKSFTLDLSQTCPPTPGQKTKAPFLFPLSLGLLSGEGKDLPLKLKDSVQAKKQAPFLKQGILLISKKNEKFVFTGIKEKPVPSLNRHFSAPIQVKTPYTTADQIFLMANDRDDFNRYEAQQQLATTLLIPLIQVWRKGKDLTIDCDYVKAWGKVLLDEQLEDSFKAELLLLPPESYLHLGQNPIDHQGTHEVRTWAKKLFAEKYQEDLLRIYHQLRAVNDNSIDPLMAGHRHLKNMALGLLMSLESPEINQLCFNQLKDAINMTDELTALTFLAHQECPQKEQAIQLFYDKWKQEPLVMQKWIMAQATSPLEETFAKISQLEKDPIYNGKIPNFIRALFGVFTQNHIHFHCPSGRGYQLIAQKIIEVDNYNPMMAAALAKTFRDYPRLPKENKKKAKEQLERIKKAKPSKNTYEIVVKTIGK
ncbi:MAG: aminopeptidase N [Pseudomonadota bacterium]